MAAAAAAEGASPRPHGVVWATRSRKMQETPWPCLLTNPSRPKVSLLPSAENSSLALLGKCVG